MRYLHFALAVLLCVTVTTCWAFRPLPPTVVNDDDALRSYYGQCGAATGQMFPPSAAWNQRVDNLTKSPRSDAIVNYLAATVTGSQTFRIDLGEAGDSYGFNVLEASSGTSKIAFTPTSEFYTPHCDRARIPVPAQGRLEGEFDYQCAGDGDCHLVVFEPQTCKLYEMWRADDVLGNFRGGCLAVWETQSDPGPTGRGESCTSADAAGLPITPLLVIPEEIAAGTIRHALRFILPNHAVARDVYVRPGTHNPLTSGNWGDPATGPVGTEPPPYGVRLRLRADFDTSGMTRGARIMAEALKTYGMFHADGGAVTFIASNASGAAFAWNDDEVDLGPNDLRNAGLSWTDFEVVSDLDDLGSMSSGCSRSAINEF